MEGGSGFACQKSLNRVNSKTNPLWPFAILCHSSLPRDHLLLLLRRKLLNNVIRILPRQRHILSMASSCKHLTLTVAKVDRRIRQRLANYTALATSLVKVKGERNLNIHLSQVTSALIRSPILPPEERYVTFRSVETPVANRPREATAREPPRSTMLAIVPPWRIFSRFCKTRHLASACLGVHMIGEGGLTVCSFWMSSSNFTRPGVAEVTRSCGGVQSGSWVVSGERERMN